MKKIAIGSDHAGFPYKEPITTWLTNNGYEVKDFGTYSSESADYADFAHPVASGVENNEFEKGILLMRKRPGRMHHGQQTSGNPCRLGLGS